MPLGVEVNTRTAPAARGASGVCDTLFVVGKAGTGPLDSFTRVRSLSDFAGVYGVRDSNNRVIYDGLDAFFREGGRQAIFARYNDTGTITAGLSLLPKGLGAGQIVAWSETPGSSTYTTLLTHAKAFNRFALLDVADADTIAAMSTLGTTYSALTDREYGFLVGPWATVPAPAGVSGGTARSVQGSAVAAALMARADALGNPNRAAAGMDFPLQYTTGFARAVTDDERNTLLNLGVNTFADKFGVLQLYGFQTGIAQTDDTPFWQANAVRGRMWLKARAEVAGEHYMFKQIDGRGRLARALKTDLDTIALELFQANGLFGEDPADAFSTEVGAAVNTVGSASQGELRAVMEARFSLHSKRVLIDLVSVPVNGRVSSAT